MPTATGGEGGDRDKDPQAHAAASSSSSSCPSVPGHASPPQKHLLLDHRNPFKLPSDEEVFRLREEERKRRVAEKNRQQALKIWQKTSSRSGPDSISRSMRLQQLLHASHGPGELEGARVEAKHSRGSPTRPGVGEGGGGGGGGGGAHAGQEKENMTEFIAKKREMFLVQMSLDTKREEIRKLEEKVALKEEALLKSEQMLEEDAVRFDTFLKENDKKAHEAIKRAEKETKLKQDKVQEIKKLNQQIQMVQSEMAKHEDALKECEQYKKFLDALTPDEWFTTQKRLKLERQRARRQARNEIKRQGWEEEKRRLIEEYEKREKLDEEVQGKQGRLLKKKDKQSNKSKEASSSSATASSSSIPEKLLPPQPNFDAEPLTDSGEDTPMYFTQPSQLLEIFQALEEQNLFLIQNSQETEQALEELKTTFRETKQKMDAKTQSLKQNIEELQQQIGAEESKAEQLRQRISNSTGEAQVKQEKLLRQLNEKVMEVYKQCGFDASSNPSTLFMLSELEARLEDLLSALEQMPEEYVVKAEKEKEKKRREKKRQEQQELQLRMQEDRNRKALERSMQAPKKRVGRQVMFRSQPVRRAVKEEKQEIDQDALDELKYLR